MMKKALLLALGLVATNAFANSETSAAVSVNDKPIMKIAVYDVSNKVARELGNKFSLKESKNQRLCWVVFNMPFQPNSNTVIEEFTAPTNKAKFIAPQASVVVSKDGKTSTITRSMVAKNNEYIENCWRFDNSDPLGKYTLKVQVNNVTFGTSEFEIVK